MLKFRSVLLLCAIVVAAFFLNPSVALMQSVPGTLPTTGVGLDGNLFTSLAPVVGTLGALGIGAWATRRK